MLCGVAPAARGPDRCCRSAECRGWVPGQPRLCVWELASAGVQEQGGFTVRVFPESLPSFWQSASPCFPEPGLYLHLSSVALSRLLIPRLSEGAPCADAAPPKAPWPHANTSCSRKDGDVALQQHTLYSKCARRKGSWVGFFCSRVFGLFYLPAALAVLLSTIKVLPLAGSPLCFPLSELSKPHISLSPDLLHFSPNHPEAPGDLPHCSVHPGRPSLVPTSQWVSPALSGGQRSLPSCCWLPLGHQGRGCCSSWAGSGAHPAEPWQSLSAVPPARGRSHG